MAITSTDATVAAVDAAHDVEGSTQQRHRRVPLFEASLMACWRITGLPADADRRPPQPELVGVDRPRWRLPHDQPTPGTQRRRRCRPGDPGARSSSPVRRRAGVPARDRLRRLPRGVRPAELVVRPASSSVNIRNLAGVPSIVYGILGLAIFVQVAGELHRRRDRSSPAGSPLAILVLPDRHHHDLRGVPGRAPEHPGGGATASGPAEWEVDAEPRAALRRPRHPHRHRAVAGSGARRGGPADPGRCRHRILRHVRRRGLRGNEIKGPFTALPNVAFNWARQPGSGWPENTAAAILVMLVVILAVNAFAILLRNRYDRKKG